MPSFLSVIGQSLFSQPGRCQAGTRQAGHGSPRPPRMPETRNASAGTCQAGACVSPQRRRPELFSPPGLDPVQPAHRRHCGSCPGQVRWFKHLSNTIANTGLQLKQTNNQIHCKGKETPATLSLSAEQCRYELQEQVRGEAILKRRANYLPKFRVNRVTPCRNCLQTAA